MTRDEFLAHLNDQKAQLVLYMTFKSKAEDWHAVADAAMDIREIDAARNALQVKFDEDIVDETMNWTTPEALQAGQTVQIRIPRRFKVE